MGNYNLPVDFSKFKVIKFIPHLFRESYESYGCGATALATITGVHPVQICLKSPSVADWKDEFMANFLKKRGYLVVQLTKCNLTYKRAFEEIIGVNHVLLVSQLIKKNEASWSVIYKDYIFHNFRISTLTPLDFLVNPLLSAYVVCHTDWKKN